MKKINFKSVSSTLSQKEMKNVLGGSGCNCCYWNCSETHDGRVVLAAFSSLSQEDCWNHVYNLCAGAFTIRPCPF